jgi:hypothetical protein
MHYPRIEDNIK